MKNDTKSPSRPFATRSTTRSTSRSTSRSSSRSTSRSSSRKPAAASSFPDDRKRKTDINPFMRDKRRADAGASDAPVDRPPRPERSDRPERKSFNPNFTPDNKPAWGDAPAGKKSYERKSYGSAERKPFERKDGERKPYARRDDERGGGEGRPYERKSDDRRESGRKPYERKEGAGRKSGFGAGAGRGGFEKREGFEKKGAFGKPAEGSDKKRIFGKPAREGFGAKSAFGKPAREGFEKKSAFGKPRKDGFAPKRREAEGQDGATFKPRRATGGEDDFKPRRAAERDADGFKPRSAGSRDGVPSKFRKTFGGASSAGTERGERTGRTPRAEGVEKVRRAPRVVGAMDAERGPRAEGETARAPRTTKTFKTTRALGGTGMERAAGVTRKAPRAMAEEGVARAVKAPRVAGAVRLNRFVATSGVCSRREADQYIVAGVVTVNGQVITELGTKVTPGDDVRFNGEPLSGEQKVYILMNKPKGFVTTVEDPHADRTVIDIVKGKCDQRVYPVGRLDRNSMGVLLITNDGDLTRTLTHPSFDKKKIYQVTLDKSLTKADMERMLAGVELEDGPISVDDASWLDAGKKEIGVEVHSGRNRVIRRIFEHLGYKVTKLDRVYFAGLTKTGLRRGAWRFLSPAEIAMLKSGRYE